jgi:UDP-N-acetylmuramoyl-tripeptide--D-alanyl-D-alanine ligase
MAEPLWTGRDIADALDLSSPDADGVRVSGVSIDSRTLQRGDLFVAIKGERMDGRRFVGAAFGNGAAAAIVDLAFEPASASSDALFRVPDTLEALNALARQSRERSKARVIAVTGSVGKTGTKEMLRTMLSTSGSTHASEKSYNNLWGVPLSLARMPRDAAFGVFEIGMNHAGEITPLTRLVRPHSAIVTWVAPVHIEFFKSVSEIADAKAEIFDGFEQGGTAILPANNEHFARLAAHARAKEARVVTFGESAGVDARLLAFEPAETGSLVTAEILGSRLAFRIGARGRHLALNALAALSAAKLAGASLEAAAQSLAHFEAPEGRGRSVTFHSPEGPVLVIDESYNANPASMRAALEVLRTAGRGTCARRIAVLGDMLELGHEAPQFHADLASAVDSDGIDLVFCAGPLMAHLYERLPRHKRGGWACTSEDLSSVLLDRVRGGDAVMIKGSLGSRMGQLADALRLRFSSAEADEQGRGAA